MPDLDAAENHDPQPIGRSARFRSAMHGSWLRAICMLSPVTLALLAAGAGLVLRIDGLDRKSLWEDEVSTARRVALPSLGAVFDDLNESPFPPLYYALIWVWSRVWGIGDLSLRSLPALFGILALPATYLVWRPILGRRAAAWTIVLLALNAYHIYYSQDAKMYSAVWLLAVISCGALLNALAPVVSGRFKWLALYWFTTALLPLISFVGIVPIGVQVTFCLLLIWWRPERRWAVFDAATAMLLAVIPSLLIALPTAMKATSQGRGIDWIPSLTIAQVPRELSRYLGVLSLGYRSSSESPQGPLAEFLALAFAPCTALVAALLIVTMVTAMRRAETRTGYWWRSDNRPVKPEVFTFLAIWLVLPAIIAMMTTLMGRPFWGVPRYLFGSAPALMIWLGLALSTFKPRLAMCLALALIVPNLASITFDRTYCTRIPWRRLTGAIAGAAATLSPKNPTGNTTGPAEVELAIVALPGRKFDRSSLNYALQHGTNTPILVQADFLDISEAIARDLPFVVVMNLYMGSTQPDAMRPEVEQATGPTWACRRIFQEQTFQEPYTAMPTPYMRHSVEAWLCQPTSSTGVTGER